MVLIPLFVLNKCLNVGVQKNFQLKNFVLNFQTIQQSYYCIE